MKSREKELLSEIYEICCELKDLIKDDNMWNHFWYWYNLLKMDIDLKEMKNEFGDENEK